MEKEYFERVFMFALQDLKGSEHAMANARLICAAPDLLQVAKDFVLLCELHDLEGAVLDSAKEAIANAERGEA